MQGKRRNPKNHLTQYHQTAIRKVQTLKRMELNSQVCQKQNLLNSAGKQYL